MVRLKAKKKQTPHKIETCFNSIMVRLKVNLLKPIPPLSMKFQFHYGTIKSFQVARCICRSFVSIPLWYD